MATRIKTFYRLARRPGEYLMIALAEVIIPPLSRVALLRLSRFIAAVTFLLDGRGKAVARANLRLMFGARLNPVRERAIIHGAYRNMARVLVTISWMARDTRARITDQVAFAPALLDTIQAHTPAVMVSAHLGNWEILSQACVANGIPVTSVAKPIGTPAMTDRLTRLRSTIGQEIVPAVGAFRLLWRALKAGRSVGLLVDQHTHTWQGGAWVTFFGLPAGISLTPAILARKCDVPLVFAWSRPLKDGRYRIEFGHLFPADPLIPDAERMQQLATAFEAVIRRHPSLWCLNYRRWRYILPGDAPARYPFYARVLRTAPANRTEGRPPC